MEREKTLTLQAETKNNKMMKKANFLLLITLVIVSCINTKKDTFDTTTPSTENNLLMGNTIDKNLTTFIKYRSFDEYTLKGIGLPDEGKEYVEVARNDSCIIVKRSYLQDSIICYRYRDGVWTNIIVRNWENKDQMLVKDPFAELATIYYRIVGNDSIVEYGYSVYQDYINKVVFIKCKNKCFKIVLLPDKDILNMSDPFPELKNLIHRYNTDSVIFMGERNKEGDKRSVINYTKVIKGNHVTFSCGNKEHLNYAGHYYVFIMEPIGELSIQPGFEKYKRELSWCRDIRESQ